MPDPFTDEQIEQLTNEINRQLLELGTPDPAEQKSGRRGPSRTEPQFEAIAKATGQDAPTFLARFREAARKDLCEEGGILHAQWTRYRDLASKDMLKTFGGILIGLGLSGNALSIVAVAIAVHILYLGADAFCRGQD
jgi:hypothetical protein